MQYVHVSKGVSIETLKSLKSATDNAYSTIYFIFVNSVCSYLHSNFYTVRSYEYDSSGTFVCDDVDANK